MERAERADVLAEGERLGLPRDWLELLPRIEELPGNYSVERVGGDAFLVWKAQEHLARTGRLAETDADLVAEALEDAAAADGPGWLHKAQQRLMFLLAWPGRTYHLHVELGMAIEHLRACLEESPSMWPFVDGSHRRSWSLARFDAQGLDEAVDLPEACPWPTLDDLIRAGEERLAADRQRFW